MRDTQNIITILTNSGEAYEIKLTPEQLPETLAWATDQYYKSGIEAFWVNGEKFEEPAE